VNELSSYVFSPLREGDVGVYRGSGNGLSPILVVSADENSPGSVERLEHEFAVPSRPLGRVLSMLIALLFPVIVENYSGWPSFPIVLQISKSAGRESHSARSQDHGRCESGGTHPAR
jgi:hypothetical protein